GDASAASPLSSFFSLAATGRVTTARAASATARTIHFPCESSLSIRILRLASIEAADALKGSDHPPKRPPGCLKSSAAKGRMRQPAPPAGGHLIENEARPHRRYTCPVACPAQGAHVRWRPGRIKSQIGRSVVD